MPAITIRPSDPTSVEDSIILEELSRELKRITGRDGTDSFASKDVLVPRSIFLVAYDGQRAVGCGALRPITNEIAEIKRMFTREKRKGVGSEILKALEYYAIQFGYQSLWLETGVENIPAVTFYRNHGYRVRENFGKYLGRSECLCFEKKVPLRFTRSLAP